MFIQNQGLNDVYRELIQRYIPAGQIIVISQTALCDLISLETL